MKKENRHKLIIEILRKNKASNVKNLSRELDVSHMTIRRDINEMKKQNLISVLHGSFFLNTPENLSTNEKPYSLLTAESVHTEEKRLIGIMAASLIDPEDTLIIDYGSTAEYFAKNIPSDIPLTILSYSLNVITDIAHKDNCRLIFSGGEFHKSTLSFESPEGLEMIKNFRANKAFITAAGIDDKFGATCSNYYERPTKKALLQSSQRKILLVDSSKFGQIKSVYFADLNEFDEIITDKGIPDKYREIIISLGIKLTIAE